MRNAESDVGGKYDFKKFCFPLKIYFPFGISFRETGMQI